MNKEIEKKIVKFLTNCANEEDLNELANWLKTKDNTQLFDHYIETNYALDMNMNKFDSRGVKNALKGKIKQDKNVFYQYKIFKAFKYAATAAIIFGMGFFLRDSIFKSSTETTPIIVNTTNAIEPGTDKATLTLEDGSTVTLEKGESFQMQNVNSNGEEIVYRKDKQKTAELVYNYLTIPRGGQFYLVLSDGTKVWLNSESQLKYPVNFVEGEKRQVELVYGEAYFDVTPSSENNGAKFIVLNKSQEVEVLGTEFNIKAYKDEANIFTTLVEGKVAVKYEAGRQNLVPNQQLTYDTQAKITSIKNVDVYNETSWKDGVFSFERKPLKDIMKVLSRWYDVDIIFDSQSLEEVKFFGNLEKDQNIQEILETIKRFKTIEAYEITGKTIILK